MKARMRQSRQHPIFTLWYFLLVVTFVLLLLLIFPKQVASFMPCWVHRRNHQPPQNNAARLLVRDVLLPFINVAHPMTTTVRTSSSSLGNNNDNSNDFDNENINNNNITTTAAYHHHQPGRLEELKQREAELSAMLAAVRREKTLAIQSRPLTIGVIGFARFGKFISKTFAKYGGRVVVTSRSDYSDIAQNMGVTYVPLSDPATFLRHNLDVIVVAVSIMSFRATVQALVPYLQDDLERRRVAADAAVVAGPLVVDVCSVKEHPRRIMLDLLPPECDILCTHPMFGPDSGKHGWQGLNFVYEKTRVDQVLLGPEEQQQQRGKITHHTAEDNSNTAKRASSSSSESYIEGMDRMERFLSIWEEEGCRMVPMTCKDHDTYAANSQFVTHLIGRVLGSQGLVETPIDTIGFKSVLNLIDSTAADSFELFYGLYKYNKNSLETIKQLQSALHDVVGKLHMTDIMNQEDEEKQTEEKQEQKQQQERKIVEAATADEQPIPKEQDKQETSILDQ